MGKRTTTLPLALPSQDPDLPAYRWLYVAVRTAILEGRLQPGRRLPSTRALAAEYGLSRGTVVRAYEQLQSEGYLEARTGSGTYVTDTLPEELLHAAPEGDASSPARRSRERRLSDYGRRVEALAPYELGAARAFRTNQPAVDLFPVPLWARIAARRLRRASTEMLLGCGPFGYPPLQEAVADYLRTSRGVHCTAERVAIVSGVQEALDLVARILLNPGDRVAMEDPGYVGAARVFEAHGAEIAAVPVDGEGMERPEADIPAIRLAYVTPGHQFPLGISMSAARRLELLAWARATNALIVEDDYDSEYRYAGRPLPALQSLDRHGCVLFAGSFSKVLFPSLRLGYLVVPDDLVDPFAAVLSTTKRHAPLFDQAVLADFIAGGHFGRHLRRMREVYAERASVLMEEASNVLGGLMEIPRIEAGLQTVGWLEPGLDGTLAAEAAARQNVEVTPLSRYGRRRMPREGLLLGFAAVDPKEIRRGLQGLAGALRKAGGG